MTNNTTDKKYFYGTGRRKTAIARVRLFQKGTGKVVINDVEKTNEEDVYNEPLKLAGQFGTTDLSIKVSGGGHQGQLEAIRHGVARALVAMDAELKTTLKKSGLLTRDPRMKERKKPGLKSARRSPQWSKR